MLPDIDEWESILFATLLFGPDTCSGLASRFKSAIGKGDWKVPRKMKLGQVGHVHKILKGMEEVIFQLDQETIKKELKKTNRSKKGNIGKYYAINPKFLISLLGPGAVATEEDARAFLQFLEEFSPGGPAVIKNLNGFRHYDFNTVILGYVRCIVEEISIFFSKEGTITVNKQAASYDYKRILTARQPIFRSDSYNNYRTLKDKIPKEAFKEAFREALKNLARSSLSTDDKVQESKARIDDYIKNIHGSREKQQLLITKSKYIKFKIDYNIKEELFPPIRRFCLDFKYFYDRDLMWEMLKKEGVEIPAYLY